MNPPGPAGTVGELLLSVLRRRRRLLVRLAGWSLVAAVPAFLSGLLVARALDDGFLAGRPATGFGWLGLLAAGALVGAFGTRQTYRRLAGVVEPFRDELVALGVTGTVRRSTLPGATADTAGVARLTRQVEIVRESFANLLMIVESFLATAVGALLGLAVLAPTMVLLVLPPLLVGIGLFLAALASMARRQRTIVLAEEEIAEQAARLTAGLRDVVACGAEHATHAAAGRSVDAQACAATELARFTALRTLALGIGGWLPVIAILVAAPWLLRDGVTTGALLGGVTYVVQGVQPALQHLVRVVGGSALLLGVTLGRIVEVSAASPPTRPVLAGARPRGDHLELSGVTFGYGGQAEPVLRAVDLLIPAGEHIVVVGPSGVGKSTLAALVTGMLEPNSGLVRLGGVPLTAWRHAELIEHRVLIPQEAYVFTGTLRENLRYLRPDACTDEVAAAVHAVGMAPLVERLGGYDIEIDPIVLSAGERQLVALARAHLSPARLVVLDEATCHLDPETEMRAELAFAERGGTLLIVAHRISSALRADRILLLDDGAVLAGTHQELLVRSALYRDLAGRWNDGDPTTQ